MKQERGNNSSHSTRLDYRFTVKLKVIRKSLELPGGEFPLRHAGNLTLPYSSSFVISVLAQIDLRNLSRGVHNKRQTVQGHKQVRLSSPHQHLWFVKP